MLGRRDTRLITGRGCSDGASSAPRSPVNFTRVVSADASTITLEGPNGAPTAIPLSEVGGVSVNRRRGRAAVIGAGIVGGTVVVVTTVVLAVQAANIIRASSTSTAGAQDATLQ